MNPRVIVSRGLGYIPDAAARALSSRRTRTIGAIIPTVDNAMFARGTEALQAYLSLQGYLLLATSGYDPEIEARQAQNMASRGIYGLILRGDTHTPIPCAACSRRSAFLL